MRIVPSVGHQSHQARFQTTTRIFVTSCDAVLLPGRRARNFLLTFAYWNLLKLR
jgi:hypothetical protein